MKTKSIQTFVVKFSNELAFGEIPLFRGAVINSLGANPELLFHNHTGDNTYRYSYPLIQYKRIHKKAAIFCIGEGVDVMGEFLSANNFSIMLGERPVKLTIEAVSPKRTLVQTWDSVFRYHLNNWIPLNSTNYQDYKDIEEISERIAFLEKILIGNLLSFAKGVNIEVKEQIQCKLISLREPRIVEIKKIKMMSFDAEFRTNISLPDYVGLGKHVSVGYGTVVKTHNENNIE